MKENFFPSRIIEIVGLLLISLLLPAPYLFMARKGLPTEMNYLIFLVLWLSIFIGISIFVNRRRKQKMELNFKIVDFRYLYLMLIIILIFKIGFNIPVDNLIGNTKLSNPFINLSYVLVLVIIAPILEEFIFRGIILKGLLTRYSPKFAIIVSALLFGLFHFSSQQIWHAFLMGLLWGWIYYKTKSIGTVILLHCFSNFIVQGYEYMIYKYSDSYPISSVNILLIIFSVPVLILMIRILVIKMTSLDSIIIKKTINELPINHHY